MFPVRTSIFCLFLYSSLSSAACWIDAGVEPGSSLQPQHFHKLGELAKTHPQCTIIGVSAHEAFMFYNRDSGAFWEMRVAGIDIFNNSAPAVRDSMRHYFQVEWKSVSPLDERSLSAKNLDEIWNVPQPDPKKKAKKTTQEPQVKQGHEDMSGALPLEPAEKTFLKESLPLRFTISYFRRYVG